MLRNIGVLFNVINPATAKISLQTNMQKLQTIRCKQSLLTL